MRVTFASVIVIAVFASACAAAQTPPPTSLPTPTSVPTRPAATPVPTLDASTMDAQDAFLANVNDLTATVEDLATTQCPDITAEVNANPTEVGQIHGFAATLQRFGSNQVALQTDEVRTALAALNQAISHLDSTLRSCGLKTS